MVTGGCMSCGYPNVSLRELVAADTALAEKSKGDPSLGYVRYELLAEAWDSIFKLGRELFDARTRVSELEAENAKLRKCVEAADSEIDAWREWGARISGDERVCGWVHREDYGLYCLLADPPVSDISYDRARAEVDK